ncbi:MAG: MCE family protein [Mycobacterium sp.]|nr:MCE family protein [Mycobacterium sp.]
MRRYKGFLMLTVLAAVAAVVVGYFGWTAWKQHRNTITLIAQFDDAAGLFPTNNVQVLGMKVGSVTKVTPKTGYVEVEFTVDKDVKIPADAQAVTLQTSILSDRAVELTPVYRGGPVMADHTTIGLERTKTPVEFTRTLDMVDRLTTSLGGDGKGNGAVRTLVDSSAAMASGNGERIKSALSELSKALKLSADGGAHTKEQLTSVVDNLSTLMDAAAANEGTLRDFGSTVRALTQILADENLGSGTTGKQFNAVLIQLGDLLEKNHDTIKNLVINGDTALKTTVDHQRDLAELLDVAPMTLDNLYNIIDRENGAARVRVLTDKVLFDTQTVKEMCNLMHLRQLGCSTGTLADFGPDFGVSYILDGLAAMGQK